MIENYLKDLPIVSMNLDKIRRISINLSEREMNAIEDIFFCENTEGEYKKIRPLLLRVWRRMCREMDKHLEG